MQCREQPCRRRYHPCSLGLHRHATAVPGGPEPGHPEASMIQKLRDNILQLLFPPLCCGCTTPLLAENTQGFCCSCWARVVFFTSPLCLICGTELSRDVSPEDRWCGSCVQHRPPFDSARSLVYYREPVRTLLHRLKFNGDTRAVAGLRGLIEKGGCRRLIKEYDLVVPVPLFPARLKKRGLNQALVLARLFFLKESVQIDPSALKKVENTPAQSELGGLDRRRNLAGSIEAGPGAKLGGRRICLIDDVFTTGATVSECSRVLKENGAETVEVITFARTSGLSPPRYKNFKNKIRYQF